MLKLPEVDLSRFHIEHIEQKLEHSGWSDGITSTITIKVKLINSDGSSGPIDNLYSRKTIYTYGREHKDSDALLAFYKREAKAHLMWFLEHEVQECLFFDGVRYEDPHPEQTIYERARKADEEARKRYEARKKALEAEENEIANQVLKDTKLSMFSYQGLYENLRSYGRPQGKSRFLFFDELMAATQEKTDFQKAIDACLDLKTKQTQEITNEVKYLSEPQATTLDTMIQEKLQSHPLTTTMAAACGLQMTEPGKVLTSVTQEDYQRAAKNYARETSRR